MTNSWPPPSGEPNPSSWPAPAAPAWQQQPWPPQQKTANDKALEWTIPINRSAIAIIAGYIALLTIPILFAGPFAVLFGILAIVDIRNHPGSLGKGRAWFAIIYGGIGTILLIWITVQFFTWNIGGG